MYSKTPSGKASKGSVSISSTKGRLQLVFRYGGKRHFVTVGLSDTPQNRKFTEGKARQLELDMLAGKVDESWQSYIFQRKLTLVGTEPEIPTKPQPKISELWEKYTEFQASQLEASTIKVDYGSVNK
jgi:integrase